MRALALLLSLLFVALLIAGCEATVEPRNAGTLLRNQAPATCEPDLRDSPVIACLKSHCCELAKACPATGCLCAAKCNTKACAAACPLPADRALGACMASACDYPGGRP
jgi:hypothetical protein